MKFKKPDGFLTFVIADFGPLTMQESIRHRTVKIELTDEQLLKLRLKNTHYDYDRNDYYEEISNVFYEEKNDE